MNYLLKSKFKALAIHLIISFVIFLIIAAIFVFLLYPSFYFDLSGGFRGLEMMLIIDMVIGPVLTFIVFNPQKKAKETAFDFIAIGIIQFTALAYGFHTVYSQRPKLVLLFSNNPGVISSHQVVAWADDLQELSETVTFKIEGVTTVIRKPTELEKQYLGPVNSSVVDDSTQSIIEQYIPQESYLHNQFNKLPYASPWLHLDNLRKASDFAYKAIKNTPHILELEKYTYTHNNAWLFYLEGKYKAAYILLDENFKLIAKIGETNLQ